MEICLCPEHDIKIDSIDDIFIQMNISSKESNIMNTFQKLLDCHHGTVFYKDYPEDNLRKLDIHIINSEPEGVYDLESILPLDYSVFDRVRIKLNLKDPDTPFRIQLSPQLKQLYISCPKLHMLEFNSLPESLNALTLHNIDFSFEHGKKKSFPDLQNFSIRTNDMFYLELNRYMPNLETLKLNVSSIKRDTINRLYQLKECSIHAPKFNLITTGEIRTLLKQNPTVQIHLYSELPMSTVADIFTTQYKKRLLLNGKCLTATIKETVEFKSKTTVNPANAERPKSSKKANQKKYKINK